LIKLIIFHAIFYRVLISLIANGTTYFFMGNLGKTTPKYEIVDTTVSSILVKNGFIQHFLC